jgi:hypothetical protein
MPSSRKVEKRRAGGHGWYGENREEKEDRQCTEEAFIADGNKRSDGISSHYLFL